MFTHNVVFVVAGGLGCRVDDVGCVKCECVCEVESDPKSRGYMGDTTGKQFPMA